MLKIPKGLRKKKKDKKNKKKKEDELFDPAELEKYRQEHRIEDTETVDDTSSSKSQNNNVESQSDEWKKFQALTAGVDNVLKKTQGDLSRIKSTSFFQRKSPRVEQEQQKPAKNQEDSSEDTEVKNNKGAELSDIQEEKHIEESCDFEKAVEADDEDSEVDEDIFDTSYVEVVTSGKIKLANIPDSPIEEDIGFDPFDTSIADRFVKSNSNKRFLNLGCAVEVLTGRVTDTIPNITADKKPRRRPKPRDLLLESFDEETVSVSKVTEFENSPPIGKTLLDEDPLNDQITSENFTLDLSANILPKPNLNLPSVPEVLEQVSYQNEAFDSTTGGGLEKTTPSESSEDEFAQLAAESLAKKSETPEESLNDLNSAEIVPFEVNFDLEDTITEDPFPNESSPLESGSKFLTEDSEPDLFASVNDLTKIGHTPLKPNSIVEENDYSDPFDTSIVDNLLPGKQEIKLLEKELLQNVVEEDNDFDPRAEEPAKEKPIRPDHLSIKFEHFLPEEKSPSERLDLLKINQEELPGHVAKPLTPLPQEDFNNNSEIEFDDPFDTSCASDAFGKLELKLLEKELANTKFEEKTPILEKLKLTATVSTVIRIEEKEKSPIKIDILTGEPITDTEQLHTPVEPRTTFPDNSLDFDPFDTSIADNIKPGKTELKLLETELI